MAASKLLTSLQLGLSINSGGLRVWVMVTLQPKEQLPSDSQLDDNNTFCCSKMTPATSVSSLNGTRWVRILLWEKIEPISGPLVC
jgi:hypothetical protein